MNAELQREYESVIPFEPDYELIKTDPNQIYFKYEDKMQKIINSLAYWKNFDRDELKQQSYLFFIEFCGTYDPYYNGITFIPFDKFFFKNLIIKLRAHIQRHYFKHKREQPTEFNDYSLGSTTNHINEVEDKLFIDKIYGMVNQRQREILDLSIQGYKQQEIGDKLSISQSRVSVIRKKAMYKLQGVLVDQQQPKRTAVKL